MYDVINVFSAFTARRYAMLAETLIRRRFSVFRRVKINRVVQSDCSGRLSRTQLLSGSDGKIDSNRFAVPNRIADVQVTAFDSVFSPRLVSDCR